MRVPSGLNATLDTVSVWPVSGWPIGWPVSASHSRTVLSQLPEAMRLPSGLNATLVTASVWPVSGVADRLAGGRVPQPHRLVVTAGDDPRAVGAERHTVHRAGVAGQRLRRRVGRCRRPTPAPCCRRCRRRCGVPSGLNATLYTVDGRVGDLDEVDHLDQRIEQWTVIRRLRKSSRRKQLLVRAHVAAGTGTGQHRLGLGDQPPSFRLVTLVYRFLSLAIRFLLFHDGDRCRRRPR